MHVNIPVRRQSGKKKKLLRSAPSILFLVWVPICHAAFSLVPPLSGAQRVAARLAHWMCAPSRHHVPSNTYSWSSAESRSPKTAFP